jgi:hypothetical protein
VIRTNKLTSWFFFCLGLILVGVATYIRVYTEQGGVLRIVKILSFCGGVTSALLTYEDVESTITALWRKLG